MSTCPICGSRLILGRYIPAPGEDDVDREPDWCDQCGYEDGDLP